MLSPALLAAAETAASAEKDLHIGIGEAFLFAAVGFGIVFFVLLMLFCFVKIQSAIVGAAEKAVTNAKANKESAAAEQAPAVAAASASDASAIPAGMKKADGSLGDIKLYDFDEATAAMIMAIVADQLDAPLNELYFKSIKEVTK